MLTYSFSRFGEYFKHQQNISYFIVHKVYSDDTVVSNSEQYLLRFVKNILFRRLQLIYMIGYRALNGALVKAVQTDTRMDK